MRLPFKECEMEKDLDASVKNTQKLLGKYVKRPPLTEKLLKKPPFRFLHDIVTNILKSTHFFKGLFDEEELNSENVKDKEKKIQFLNKVIAVVELTTGKALSAKSSKIIAGQEPEKTNELLQTIAYALDNQLSSNEAVNTYRQNVNITPSTEKGNKSNKSSSKKQLTARSSESLINTKKTTQEKSLVKINKDKPIVGKTKGSLVTKKESPPKKIEEAASRKVSEKRLSKESSFIRNEVKESDNLTEDSSSTENVVSSRKQDDSIFEQQERRDIDILQNELNDSSDVNLNLSQNEEFTNEDKNWSETDKDKETNCIETKSQDSVELLNDTVNIDSPPLLDNTSVTNPIVNSVPSPSETKVPTARPLSVRPSSSRPGAPRVREKYDTSITTAENLLVGKVNIITEISATEEEEESSIVIVDQNIVNENKIQITSNQHGHLVQQILDSQKELLQTGKTEIEWEFGAQKARETINQEIEQFRFNIQAISRVANPIGKLLDHIQEDVEVMRQELNQWRKSYDDTSKELIKLKTANEDSLQPLRAKVKQLKIDVQEKHYKINDLQIVIIKNSSRIEKLLAVGNVQ